MLPKVEGIVVKLSHGEFITSDTCVCVCVCVCACVRACVCVCRVSANQYASPLSGNMSGFLMHCFEHNLCI